MASLAPTDVTVSSTPGHYTRGETVPNHFDPAIVAASYIASLCGCILTVELLHRRGTGFHNLRSWFDTLSCATVLGVVGIWCMHFIGNRAIILGNGEAHLQLVYGAGFNILSVVLPIIGLSIAFATAEYPFRSSVWQWTALGCTGIFAGLSIVGMHYMGNFGVQNYTLNYVPRFLAASIIIAISDCLIVLMLFYTWRDKWINDWRKRILCAVFLAGGVSAMHFTASTKCIYSFRVYNTKAAIRSRNIQVIIAGVICGATALITLLVLILTQYRTKVLKKNSQKVMLSCVMFDPEDRILVTTEGVLPSREITDKFNPRTFDDDFDRTHPVYQWLYRVSRNWYSVSELIPRMRSHLGVCRANGDIWSVHANSGGNFQPETSTDYSIIFRERFCVAAASLASSMHLPVEKIGILYDNIVDTGTLPPDNHHFRNHNAEPRQSVHDLEMSVSITGFGKGQLLFLTRRLKAEEADKLINAGYRFGSVQQVGRNIAQNMQISPAAVESQMAALKRYNDNLLAVQKSGTWLSFFAMMPKPGNKGFDVMVKHIDQDQLLDIPLLASQPEQWQANILERMHDMTAAQCLTYLKERQNLSHLGQEEQNFIELIILAFGHLGKDLPSQLFLPARFYGKPVYAHYSRQPYGAAPVTALYSLVICADIHTQLEAYSAISRIPLSFFSIRHQCYNGSPYHAALAREIHKEFGPLLIHRRTRSGDRVKKISVNMSNGSATKIISKAPSLRRSFSRATGDNLSDSSSETYELNDTPSTTHAHDVITDANKRASKHGSAWGGILVNSETVMQHDNKSEFVHDEDDPDKGMGITVAVGTSNPEGTFVDELSAYCRGLIASKGH